VCEEVLLHDDEVVCPLFRPREWRWRMGLNGNAFGEAQLVCILCILVADRFFLQQVALRLRQYCAQGEGLARPDQRPSLRSRPGHQMWAAAVQVAAMLRSAMAW
jgi:hypothetical protein